MTEGQRSAIRELQRVEAAPDSALEILSIDRDRATVAISVDCRTIPCQEGGIPLRTRERFTISVPADFPFRVPTVWAGHTRFAGFPHVQGRSQLCLYVSPSTEWDPNDGMFGFLGRLHEWLTQAAADQLDPTGAPLHPPVAYRKVDKMVIPRVDTPSVSDDVWLGVAELRPVSDRRVDVIGWTPIFEGDPPEDVAAAILLPEPMPFEFPKQLSELLALLQERGVSREWLLLTLQYAVLHNREDDPLYVVLGTPMRGIRGSDDLKQHLTAWYIEPIFATGLRLTLNKYREDLELQKIGSRVEKVIWDWAESTEAKWCAVHELRPEIVTRRDADVPMSWFVDRSVAIWGSGALGGQVAEMLARAGVKKLVLVDHDGVTPGILVRQRFDDGDVGEPKVEALARALNRIRPDLEVESHFRNVLSGPLAAEDWTLGAELLIDTTAARAVIKKLELRSHAEAGMPIPVISMVIGPRAERGLVAVSRQGNSGGPVDVLRKTRGVLRSRNDLDMYRKAFWPDPQERQARMFQPEPGCSSPTFIGSAADVSALAGIMLNAAAADLSEDDVKKTAVAHLIVQPHAVADDTPVHVRLSWKPDPIVADQRNGYEIRLSQLAWTEMQRWIKKGQRRRGRLVETGGLLLGERDAAAKVIWVSEATGPPPDSRFSEDRFICGRVGTRELCERRRKESEGAVQFVGMWHSHPDGPPLPSDVDLNGMAKLMNNVQGGARSPLLLIVGYAAGEPELGAHVFISDDDLRDEQRIPVSRAKRFHSIRYGVITVIYVGQARARGRLRSWYNGVGERLRGLIGR